MGIPVHRMEIEIISNLARVQSEMGAIKGSIGAAIDSATATLERGGRALREYESGLGNLRAQVDPLAAQEGRLAAQIDVANLAFARGDMGTQEYIRTLGFLEERMARVRKGGAGLAASAGQQRQGMQQLSFQIGDVAQQFALGTNPMIIFAQQGGQVVQAISMMKGEATGLIGFLGGPWGAVILGATMILGTLAAAHFKGGDAQNAHGKAAKSLEDSINDLDEAMKRQTATTYQSMQADYAKAESLRQAEIRTRKATQAALDHARALLVEADAAADHQGGDGGINFGTAAGGGIERQIARLDALMVKQTAALATAETAVRRSKIPILQQQVAEATDAAAAANGRYERSLGVLNDRQAAGTIGEKEYLAAGIRLQQSHNAEIAALQKHSGASDRHTASLGRQSSAMTVNASAGLELAAAYLDLGKSAIVAEARQKALTDATRKGIDGEAQTRRQLAIMLADGAVNGAKSVAQLRAETAVRADLNEQMRAGTIGAAEFNDRMKEELAVLPLLKMQQAAKMKGEADAYDLLTRIIGEYRVAMQGAREAEADTSGQLAVAQGRDQIEILKAEISLIGAGNVQRAVELAQLKERQRLKGSTLDPATQAALIAQAGEIARLDEDKNARTEAYNHQLSEQLDLLDTIDQRARILADSLSDAFGRPGQAMGDMITEFTGFAKHQQEQLERLNAAQAKYGADSVNYAQARADYERDAATAEMAHYGSLLSAAKGLFKERSAGYKVMTTLEKVYSALQLVNMIKSMVMDKAVTASSVGNSMVRGSADAAAGAAKMFASLGPLGFVAVGAMVAVLAAMGLRGLGGGGHGPSIPTAEDVQKAQGTGTVLGAGDAKSDSIAKALELIAKDTNRDLEYSSEMARSLRSIDDQIGGLAAAIAQQMGVNGGMFDTSGLGLGKTSGIDNTKLFGSAGFIGGGIGLAVAGAALIASKIPVIGGAINTIVKALFGTTKTVTLLDQGLTFAEQSVAALMDGGVIGNIYQTVETKKKSKFFGISTGSKTSVSDQLTGMDDSMEQQISLLIASLRDGVVSAATALGIDGAAAVIDAFQLNLGRISFKDLSGEEIEKELQAVFSKAADEMAGSAVAGLSAFQKVGEGLFETLTRLARDYQVVDVSLQSIGMTFGAVGAASVGARENLIELSGGLDAFAEKNNFFRDNFLTEAEQMAPVIAAVSAEMSRLGLASTDTKDEFKNVLLGLDLTTEAGQSMYAALLNVAPAFLKVSDYSAKLNGTLQEVAQTAEQLAAIEKQRRGLQIQLLEAQGRAEEALAMKREDDLAALDASNRAMQQQVWATLDAAAAAKALADAQEAAAKAAEAVANERHGLEIRLMEATGDAAGALAAKRADELAALDASNRAMLESIFAAEDLAEANAALNQVTMTAAEIAKTRRDLEIQLVEAQGDAAQALAMRRADELAALDPVLRSLQEQVWAAQDAAAALEALNAVHLTAAELARSRHDLEIRLMEAEGNAAGVLAARRADEIAAADESLRALLQQIYTAEDAATAAQALADAQAAAAQAAEAAAAELARIADERRGLEIRLAEALGDAAGALAMKRADELAALDASNRAMLESIFAAEDARAAQEALAAAQADAAKAAEEAAARVAAIADERRGLEIQLLEAQGDAIAALAAKRADELAKVDESNRALQEQVWAAQDAAEAQKALADAQAEAARAAEELASKRMDLEIRLLRATGNEIGAVAMERAREIDQLDPSLRALMQQVYAAEDLQAAQEKANSALGDTAKQFREAGQNLRDYLASLAGTAALSDEAAYRAAGAQFGAVYSRARAGDADAMGALQGAGQDFLQAARANAGSALDFQRDVGFVAGAVRDAIGIADSKASDAERQMAEMARQSDLLTLINGSVMSVHDAIMAGADAYAATLAVPSSAYVGSGGAAESVDVEGLKDEIRQLREAIAAPIAATANNTKKTADFNTRWDLNGRLGVATDSDTPLAVEISSPVEVTNPVSGGEPVPLVTQGL